MWNSIQNAPYARPMIPNPDDTKKQILEPLSKMTTANKSQYIADVKVMNYLFQAIPNDIFNSMDACKNAKEMWERIKRLMFSSDVTIHVRHSRLMDEFDKFVAKEGESLESVYENLTTLDGRVDIQTKNTCYGVNGNRNAGRQNRNQVFNVGNGNNNSNQIVQRLPRTESTPGKENVQCYNCNEKGHYARDCQIPRVCDAKYFREQMLLAMKDGAESILKDEENDFLLDNSYGEDTVEELTVVVMLMDRIQPANSNIETVPSYDAKAVSEVNASSMVHKQVSHVKRKTIIQTFDDDQIDTNIIFDDPYVENNGGTLGYKNPRCLKKAIAAQPKMYDGEMLYSAKLNIDSPDLEETLEDAEESRLKMRNKMVQLNYGKLNALYETFIPQQEFSIEQTYFIIPSTSNNGSELKEVTSNLSIPKMPKESKLLKMFDKMGVAINVDIDLRVDEDSHFIKDDTPLVSVYTTRNVLVRGMLILNAFLTKEIHAIDDFKEYEMVFVGVDVPMN
ncbi:retrovirus-related pol polyprotein from transposon TNT 1-94 [Tanacetum coccineum]